MMDAPDESELFNPMVLSTV